MMTMKKFRGAVLRFDRILLTAACLIAAAVGNASTVTLSGGKKVFAGSSAENETNP